MAIEIVSFPITNGWIFPVRYVKLPGRVNTHDFGNHRVGSGTSTKITDDVPMKLPFR